VDEADVDTALRVEAVVVGEARVSVYVHVLHVNVARAIEPEGPVGAVVQMQVLDDDVVAVGHEEAVGPKGCAAVVEVGRHTIEKVTPALPGVLGVSVDRPRSREGHVVSGIHVHDSHPCHVDDVEQPSVALDAKFRVVPDAHSGDRIVAAAKAHTATLRAVRRIIERCLNALGVQRDVGSRRAQQAAARCGSRQDIGRAEHD
jgi:hypothetical protein